MRSSDFSPHRITADLRSAIAFCTRLPLGDAAPGRSNLACASWAFPIAGAMVGAVAALIYFLACQLSLPQGAAAALALAAATALTGALHEDGLADTADGFGGGRDAAAKLAIMRDSRLGTYGACALLLSYLLRWSALASIPSPVGASLALIASHAAARAPLPMFMRLVPPARNDGLAAAAGTPGWESSAIAYGFGAIILFIALGPLAGTVGVGFLLGAAWLMGWLCREQIGGQTGDVLGALEQINEILIMLLAAVVLRAHF